MKDPFRGKALWLSLGLVSGGLHAQELSSAPEQGDVVVTAQGRPQDKRDVPLTITSYDQQTLRLLGVNDLRDLSAFVPGLTVESQYPTTPYIVIRGISTNTPDPTSEPRISVFVDGVSASRPQVALGELFDIARVEVIKGPQSTLFGRSALTGAISIVQNKADPSRSDWSVRGTLGTLGERRLESMINMPVSSGIAVRFASVLRNTDGYVANLADGSRLNGNQVAAVRGLVHAESPGGATLDLIGTAQHDRFDGLSYKSGQFYPIDPVTGAREGDLAPFSPAHLTVSSGFPTGGMGGYRSTRGVTLLGHVPLASRLSLGGTLAWSRFRTRFAGDFDGTALGIISTGEDSRNRQRSGEARLTWTPFDQLRLAFGGNIAHERASQYVPIVINEREVLALQTGVIRRTNPVLAVEATYNSTALVAQQLAGVLGASGATLPANQLAGLAGNVSTGHREDLTRTSDAHYYDIFWNGTLDVSPALQVEGGARWSRVERTSGLISIIRDRSVLAGLIGALQQPAPARAAILGALSAPGAGTIPQSAGYPIPVFGLLSQGTATAAGETAPLSDDGVTGRLAVRYAVSRRLNMFVNYARGRRPAVLSAQAPLTPNGPARFTPLAAETLDSVELGAKLRTADRRLEFDATGYIYGYRHFQTQLVRGTTLVSLDAGEARSHGVEATARYRPVTALTLFGTYAWSHARFAAGLYDGNHVRLSPDHAASAGLTAEAHGGGARFALTPTVDWRSRLFFDDTNGNLAQRADAFLPPLPYQASQAGYARANLRLGVSPDRGPWSLELFVANLTNTRYVRDLGQGSLSFGLPSYVAAPPRTFGATYTLRNMPGA